MKRLKQFLMKKRSEATQTLRAGCSKAEPKIFAPPQTLFPGAWDDQNLISWRRSLLSPTDPVWWRSMHTITSYSGNRPTNKQTNPQTGPITIHCVAKLSTQCNNAKRWTEPVVRGSLEMERVYSYSPEPTHACSTYIAGSVWPLGPTSSWTRFLDWRH